MDNLKNQADLGAVLELLADLEQRLMDARAQQLQEASQKIEPLPVILAREQARPLQAIPVMDAIPPSEPLHAVPETRPTLAENVLVQWAIAQAVPWSYQQQVLDALHKIRLSRLGVVTLVTVLLTSGVVSGVIPIPADITQKLRAIYNNLACPIQLPPQIPLEAPKQ